MVPRQQVFSAAIIMFFRVSKALDVCQQMKLILEQEEPMEAVHRILQLSEQLLAAKTFAAWLKKISSLLLLCCF